MAHIILYFIALFSLSTAPNWAKLNQMPSEVLGFYRLLVAALLLAVYVIIQKKLKKIKYDKAFGWAIVSGLFFFFHLWSYKYAAKHTTVANTMILFATNPVWSSLGSWLFFKEKITLRLVLAYLVAAFGIVILVQDHRPTLSSVWISVGDGIALISAFAYAAYMLTSKKARISLQNSEYALIQYSLTALCFGAVCVYNQPQMINYSAISWVSVLGLVLLPTFLGHFALTYLVQFMPLAPMTCGKLLEPIIASVMAWFLFHEKLGANAYLAFSFTGLSVVLLFWPQLKKYLFR